MGRRHHSTREHTAAGQGVEYREREEMKKGRQHRHLFMVLTHRKVKSTNMTPSPPLPHLHIGAANNAGEDDNVVPPCQSSSTDQALLLLFIGKQFPLAVQGGEECNPRLASHCKIAAILIHTCIVDWPVQTQITLRNLWACKHTNTASITHTAYTYKLYTIKYTHKAHKCTHKAHMYT